MECEWIGWCALKPEAQAAWVQAIGSILAILLAIAVPYWQRRTELRDRKAQDGLIARSLGTVLLREMVKFQWKISNAQRTAERAGPTGIVDISADIIPREIWEHAERLHQLGKAGHHALLAINAVQHANEELVDGRLSPTDGRSTRFQVHIGNALTECTIAVEELQMILDR